MEKKYDNQVRNYVYEPYDKELDGPMPELKKIEDIEQGFTLCENEAGYKFLVKKFDDKAKRKVYVVCDILKD
jgi:hypothetical protein